MPAIHRSCVRLEPGAACASFVLINSEEPSRLVNAFEWLADANEEAPELLYCLRQKDIYAVVPSRERSLQTICIFSRAHPPLVPVDFSPGVVVTTI